MKRTVVGLVGEAGTGKGEVANSLLQNGFEYYSLSDTLRRVSTNVGLSHERNNLIALGNALRENFGNDILAHGAKLWANQIEGNRIVIDSIRNPAEVIYLKRELNAFIVGVTMSPEKAFQLIEARRRPGDPTTLEEFLQLRNRERGVGENSSGQQLTQCFALTDFVLPNEGGISDLHRMTSELLISRGLLSEGFSLYKER